MESVDQSALGPDGQLLDASKITWYNDPNDPHPIQSTSKVQVGQCSRPIRATAGARLAEAIAAEKLNEDGSSCRHFILPRVVKASTKCKRPITAVPDDDAIQVDTNVEDKTFVIPVSDGGHNLPDLDSNDVEIGNNEIADMLPSKTIPDVKNWKHHALKPRTIKMTAAATAPSRKKARITSDTVTGSQPNRRKYAFCQHLFPEEGHNGGRCTCWDI
ncbi:hypothetical protein F5888DRAFT_1615702 [Russula emetica]|nr:hypothetical protein F5888DRAFT_1615702 [Russula emetica]